jgi:MoaA/NifB/PqqE/SkfB family radical SAM enzyme
MNRMTSPPKVMIFPVTMTCNSKCRSCGIWRLPQAAKDHASRALLDKALSDPFLRQHIESVNLSGGEPFAHPDLTTFVAGMLPAYRRLREICINTDGHLIDGIDAFLAAVLPACSDGRIKLRMYISLDGIGEYHDRHRRHPGAFALADRALRHLAALRTQWPETLRVTASFTITDRNADQIIPVLDYVRELGVRVDYNLAARPEVFIGGAGLERRFQVNADQVGQVRTAIREVCRHPASTNFSPAFYATMMETLESGHRRRGCFFPSKGFVLMPDGKVYICGTYIDFHFGDLTEADFETLWNGHARADCLDTKIPAKCGTCFSNSYEDWDLAVGAVV